MRIKVRISGHQLYNEVEGEVLAWLQGITRYDGGNLIQVPCVVLRSKNKVIVQNLQEERKQIETEVIDD